MNTHIPRIAFETPAPARRLVRTRSGLRLESQATDTHNKFIWIEESITDISEKDLSMMAKGFGMCILYSSPTDRFVLSGGFIIHEYLDTDSMGENIWVDPECNSDMAARFRIRALMAWDDVGRQTLNGGLTRDGMTIDPVFRTVIINDTPVVEDPVYGYTEYDGFADLLFPRLWLWVLEGQDSDESL